ncbi:MAG: ribonuclease J [Rickettsiales bacterium]|nr:ribonuclease J [Rickettsiales bacterium]
MSFNIKNYKEELLFIPLGGTSKVGANNLYVYHYKGKFLIVDFGSGFADDSLPGANVTVPDISFLMKHRKDILGIVLTHAHEDHIGGLKYLWTDLGCNIYATPFTSSLLKDRFLENNFTLPAEIITIDLKNPILDLAPFEIELAHMCHSTAEMHALLIRTKIGNIFHTGDWKFDSNPVIGEKNDESMLKKYGKEGVLAVVGDSTNIFNSEYSGSEGDLKESLFEMIKPCKNLVIVTSFASNIARVRSLIDIAKKCDRKISFSGRSLRKIFNIGKKTGYLNDVIEGDHIIDEREVKRYPKNKVLVVATGCQGEPLASLTKIAHLDHPHIKISHGDSVIFSSKVIPGNDAKIYRIFDKLISLGTDVVMEKTAFTHVSGHPGKKEMQKLYDLLKPKIVIPVHGGKIHLHHHVKFAQSLGMKNSILVSDGDVINLDSKGNAKKIANIDVKELAVYGNYFYEYSSSLMKTRRKLRDDGICIVVLILSNKYQLQAEPLLMFPGFLEEEHEEHFIDYIKDEIIMLVNDMQTSTRKKIEVAAKEMEKKVKSKVKGILKHEVQRVPMIRVITKIV